MSPASGAWYASDEFRRAPRSNPVSARKEREMGQPVVHFEVIGKDGDKLRSYYSELFGWKIDSNNPMHYGMVAREGNQAPDGSGIGGGIAGGPDGYEGHVTFYVGVPDIEGAPAVAGGPRRTRVMGPETILDLVELGAV